MLKKIVEMQEMQSKIDSLSLKEAIAAVKEAEMEIAILKESHQFAQMEIQRAKSELEKKDRNAEVKDAYSDRFFWENKYSSGNKNTKISNKKKEDKTARPSSYEWYLDFYEMKTFLVSDLQQTINLNCFQSELIQHRCLVAGCGNSTLCEDLMKTSLKFHKIIGVDYSETVIAQMQSRINTQDDGNKANSSSSSSSHSNKKNNIANPLTSLIYVQCDLTTHSGFPDGHFTAIIDKGTLDAISSDTNTSTNMSKLTTQADNKPSEPAYSKYIAEVCRLLAKGGRFILITTMPPEILVQIFTGTSAEDCFPTTAAASPPLAANISTTRQFGNSLDHNDNRQKGKGSGLSVDPPPPPMDLYSSLCACHREVVNSVQMKVHYYALEKHFEVCDRDTKSSFTSGDTTSSRSNGQLEDRGDMSTGNHTTLSTSCSNNSSSSTTNINIRDGDHLIQKQEKLEGGSNIPNILDSWLRYAEEILRDTMCLPEPEAGTESESYDTSTSTNRLKLSTEASSTPSVLKSTNEDIIVEEVVTQEQVTTRLMEELRLDRVRISCYDQQEQKEEAKKEEGVKEKGKADKKKMDNNMKSNPSSYLCYWGGTSLWVEYELASIGSWDEDDYICLSVSLPAITPEGTKEKEKETASATPTTTTTSSNSPNSHYECFEYTVPPTPTPTPTATKNRKASRKSTRCTGGLPLSLPMYSGLFHISYFRTITTTTTTTSEESSGTRRRILKRHIELGRTPHFSLLSPLWHHSPLIPFIGSRGGLSLRSGSVAWANKQQQAKDSVGQVKEGERNEGSSTSSGGHFSFFLEYLKGTKVICVTATTTTTKESELSVEPLQSENKMTTSPIISRANMWIYDKNAGNNNGSIGDSYAKWTAVVEADLITATSDSALSTTATTTIEEVSIPVAWMNSFSHQDILATNAAADGSTTANHHNRSLPATYPSLALEGSQCEILHIGGRYSIRGRLFQHETPQPSIGPGPLQSSYCLPATATATATPSGRRQDNRLVVSITCRYCKANLLASKMVEDVSSSSSPSSSTSHSYGGGSSREVFREMHISPLPEGYFDQVMYDCICCEDPSSSFPLSLAELTTPPDALLLSSYQLAVNAADIAAEALVWESKTTASLLDLLATAGGVVGGGVVGGAAGGVSSMMLATGSSAHCSRCYSLLGDSSSCDTGASALSPSDVRVEQDKSTVDDRELRLLRHCISIGIKDSRMVKVEEDSLDRGIQHAITGNSHNVNKEEVDNNKPFVINSSIAAMLSNLSTEQVVSRILLQLRDTGNRYSFLLFVPHCDRWSIAIKLLTSDYHVYIPSEGGCSSSSGSSSNSSSSGSSSGTEQQRVDYQLIVDYRAIRCCFSRTDRGGGLLPIPLALHEIITIHQRLLVRCQMTVEICPFKNYSLSYLRY